MSEVLSVPFPLFELNIDEVDSELSKREADRATEAALVLGKVAMDFSRVERKPRYDSESRESDVEHSYMLQLVSVELAEAHLPGLDNGLVAKFCGVHDLPELIVGDVPTFDISSEELSQKAQSEAAALETLEQQLPPHTFSLLARYEEQTEPEARFVRFVDKLLPLIVDIHGPGMQVMTEDYDTHDLASYNKADAKQRQRCEDLFDEPEFQILHKMRAILSKKFSQEFTT